MGIVPHERLQACQAWQGIQQAIATVWGRIIDVVGKIETVQMLAPWVVGGLEEGEEPGEVSLVADSDLVTEKELGTPHPACTASGKKAS